MFLNIIKGVFTPSEKRACNSHGNCKIFSVTKNSNIAQVRACVPILPIERVLKIVTLKNFDGCTSCMPSSLKESLTALVVQFLFF